MLPLALLRRSFAWSTLDACKQVKVLKMTVVDLLSEAIIACNALSAGPAVKESLCFCNFA